MNNPTQEIVGREELIESLWRAISADSMIMMDAPRRIGKTTIMKEMATHSPENIQAFWIDLEDVGDAYEFYRRVYVHTQSILGRPTRFWTGTKRFFGTIGGLEIGPVKLPEIKPLEWSALFDSLIKSLMQHTQNKLVFFFDEIPLMLHTIARQQKASDAQDIMNALRRLAEEYKSRLSIVYAGSLGLHHVIRYIRQQTVLNAPSINIARVFAVPPLAPEHGAEVARTILQYGKVEYDESVPHTIAKATDGIPFYIRSIALAMGSKPSPWTDAEVVALVQAQIRAAGDLLHIDNDHLGRLANQDYYEAEFQEDVYHLLSMICASHPDGVSKAKLLTQARDRNMSTVDFNELIGRLSRDHILDVAPSPEGQIVFKYEIVRGYWESHYVV